MHPIFIGFIAILILGAIGAMIWVLYKTVHPNSSSGNSASNRWSSSSTRGGQSCSSLGSRPTVSLPPIQSIEEQQQNKMQTESPHDELNGLNESNAIDIDIADDQIV